MTPGGGRRLGTLAVAAASLLASACGRHPAPPNIVWIVVDTLRADHLPFYGYARDTAPRAAALLARRGTQLEHAYAQAPWTLPSAASYLTGLDPARLANDEGEITRIPRGFPSLAERLRELGFSTAGFTANFLLDKHNGFQRGFDHFWSARGGDSLREHAESMQEPLLDWLRARPRDRRPLFLYVHYLDPHDPYENPDMPDGRSRFDPGYAGPFGGRDAHKIYVGVLAPDDPDAAARRLMALYDSEIRYVDRFLGELVEESRRRLGRNTLFVLSSDHGEEFHEHGGWKHGQTLYEEQIRVPLLFRWDGRIPAGRRVTGEVRLLDVVPTLLAAAGAAPTAGLDGENLLPMLLDRAREPPRRAAFASHWNFGRRRSAVVADRRKVILFNPRETFAAPQAVRERIEARDLARLERVERYDLARDPGERSRLGRPIGPDEPALLDALVGGLDPALAGVRLLVRNLPPGATVEGQLEMEGAPQLVRPLFLGPDDELVVEGAAVRYRFVGDGVPKGLEIVGAGGVVDGAWRASGPGGEELTAVAGRGERYGGGPLPLERLEVAVLPPSTGAPELRLWSRREPAIRPGDPSVEAETERRLRALGYLQ